MQASEFVDLNAWISREIVQRKLQNRYQELIALVQQNSNPGNSKASFEQQRENLLATLRSIDTASLSPDQSIVLDKLGMLSSIGPAAAVNIDNILIRDAADLITVVNKVQKLAQSLESGVQRISQIASGLSGLVSESPSDPENIVLRISFDKGAALNNVVDLKQWSKVWYDIGRGIAMAQGEGPESFRIIGASKGSVVLFLAVSIAAAKMVSKILNDALDIANKYLDAKKKIEEIRALKIQNDKDSLAALSQGIEKDKDTAIAQLTKSAIGTVQNADGETEKVVGIAVTSLVRFVTKGGSIDCLLPPPPTPKKGAPPPSSEEAQKLAAVDELRESYKRIRQLEEQVHAIEFVPLSDDQSHENE